MVQNTNLSIGLVEDSSQRLIGYCRVLTDFVFRATLYDVIVDDPWQGRGFGQRLMDAVCQHPKLQKVSSIMLCCEPSMIPFYERWGFVVSGPESLWMVLRQREGQVDVEQTA